MQIPHRKTSGRWWIQTKELPAVRQQCYLPCCPSSDRENSLDAAPVELHSKQKHMTCIDTVEAARVDCKGWDRVIHIQMCC